MFISYKKYKEMQDLAEGYRKSRDEKISDIGDLKMQIASLENRIENLTYQNEKLIDWLEKVVNELGCYKVDKHNCVQIPICENSYMRCDKNGFFNGRTSQIVIPEIRFYKIEKAGD